MGVPFVKAPCEAEAQCAVLAAAGKVSNDALPFSSRTCDNRGAHVRVLHTRTHNLHMHAQLTRATTQTHTRARAHKHTHTPRVHTARCLRRAQRTWMPSLLARQFCFVTSRTRKRARCRSARWAQLLRLRWALWWHRCLVLLSLCSFLYSTAESDQSPKQHNNRHSQLTASPIRVRVRRYPNQQFCWFFRPLLRAKEDPGRFPY
jgi:hypothetical protein